jgi:hypothetical protein
MRDSLLKRVDYYLGKMGTDRNALKAFLEFHDISYQITFLDAFAEPDDIYLISEFLQIPSSQLFEVTQYKDRLVRAIFEEEWPNFETRINVPKPEAYKRVISAREFKGEIIGSGIRNEIVLIMEGLIPPRRVMIGCDYPDCRCITGCRITGWKLGPEG